MKSRSQKSKLHQNLVFGDCLYGEMFNLGMPDLDWLDIPLIQVISGKGSRVKTIRTKRKENERHLS